VPPDPPVPVEAHYVAPNLLVDFDQDLQPGPVDEGNWFMAFEDRLYYSDNAWIAPGQPRRVQCHMFVHAGIIGPNACWYYPPPFDVISVKDIPAERFEPFPVT